MRIDPGSPKKATNLSINRDLLHAARAHRINLSATLEAALLEKLKDLATDDWATANESALEEYEAHVASHGVFSDGLRRF